MYSIKMLPLAKQDVREAARWYNQRQKGLGKRFTAQIREKVKFIQSNPFASPARYDDIHTAVVNIFPYMIHYMIDDQKKEILVNAVLHTKRNPGIWKDRK